MSKYFNWIIINKILLLFMDNYETIVLINKEINNISKLFSTLSENSIGTVKISNKFLTLQLLLLHKLEKRYLYKVESQII